MPTTTDDTMREAEAVRAEFAAQIITREECFRLALEHLALHSANMTLGDVREFCLVALNGENLP